MNEHDYQLALIERLKVRFFGCWIFEQDPQKIQGIPDLLLLHKCNWGMLEVKVSEKAPRQPNQEYYVKLFDNIGFASFIYPENEREVLDALQRSFEVSGQARIPESLVVPLASV